MSFDRGGAWIVPNGVWNPSPKTAVQSMFLHKMDMRGIWTVYAQWNRKQAPIIRGMEHGNYSIEKPGSSYMDLMGISQVCPLPIIMPDAGWRHGFTTGMCCAIRFHGDCRESSI